MSAGLRTLGIMGGFGPLAGAHFYRRLVELTDAGSDPQHLPVVLLSDPGVPSRILHLEGRGESPLPRLVEMARGLERLGADLIAIPSATVHAYHREIAASVDAEVLHLPRAVIGSLSRRGIRSVALLATTPTVRLGLYRESAEEAGIRLLVPDTGAQDELMAIISGIKGEGAESAAAALSELAERAFRDSADALLLGCTELPAVFTPALRPIGTVDATDEFARAAIIAAGGQVRAD